MLQGTSITHADDLCWGGTMNLKKIVTEPLQKLFPVSIYIKC